MSHVASIDRRVSTPLGLEVAFRLILERDEAPHAAARNADRAFGAATRIDDVLRSTGNETAISEILASAADAMFGKWEGRPAHEEPSHAAHAAYYVGFALCWMVMQQINGAIR